MIRCSGLSRSFGGVRAVEGMTLEVPDGSIVALLGPNGAGKTTTVRMLCGLIGIGEGRATIDDISVNEQPNRARARSGVLMGEAALYGTMTMREYLAFFGEAFGLTRRDAAVRAGELSAEVGLAARMNDKIGTFSKGMKQRVALARALVNDPRALFLDEPTSGLDVEAALEFRDRIRGFRDERRSIVLCTHVLAEAEQLADHVVVIQKGRIVAQGAPRELTRSASGRRFAVEVSGTPDAAAITEGLPVSDVNVGANSLGFTTQDPVATNPEIVRRLVRAKIDVISVTESSRSLEQAYVDIVRGEHGD